MRGCTELVFYALKVNRVLMCLVVCVLLSIRCLTCPCVGQLLLTRHRSKIRLQEGPRHHNVSSAHVCVLLRQWRLTDRKD